jgi:hypothetical protein
MTKKSLQKEVNKVKEEIEFLEAKEPELEVFAVQSLQQKQQIYQEFSNNKGKLILIRCY